MRATNLCGLSSVSLVMVLTGCGGAEEADYADGAIEYVIPYNPGGSSDPAGREFSSQLGEELGSDVVVENLPGGDETIGVSSVIESSPNDHRLGLTSQAGVIVQPMVNESLSFQSVDDYTPVGRMLEAPNAIFVADDSPIEDLSDLIQAAEEDPGGVSIGSTGAMTSPMFAVMALGDAADVEFNPVAFSGGAGEAAMAVMGGDIDAFSATAAGQLGLVESGDIRPIAHTGDSDYDSVLGGGVSFESEGFDIPFSATYLTVAPPEVDEAALEPLREAVQSVASSDSWEDWTADNGFTAAPLVGDELLEWIELEEEINAEAIELAESADVDEE